MPLSRIDFLKQISLFAGATVLPGLPVKEVIVYDKLYLLHSFVRGFQYYKGPKLLAEMKEGDQIELVREPDNDYDECAIALHWNRQKIGFVPAELNDTLSKLLDIGYPQLVAEITHLDPRAATWENVAVAISVLRPRPVDEELPATAAALQTLDTPKYHSLKLDNNQIARVYWEDNDDEEDDEWYDTLVGHSRDDGIYDLIHSNLTSSTYGKGKHTFVISRQEAANLEPKLRKKLDKAFRKVQQKTNGLEDYLLLKGNQAEALIPRVVNLAEVADTAGNRFIRLVIHTV